MFFAVLLLVFNVWALYNIPVVIVGVRHLLKASKRKSESLSFIEEKMPTVSIIVR